MQLSKTSIDHAKKFINAGKFCSQAPKFEDFTDLARFIILAPESRVRKKVLNKRLSGKKWADDKVRDRSGRA